MSPRVVAVVVAYNRRELVTETLAALTRQDRRPDAIVVVDNASDDGSGDAVAAGFPEVSLLRLERNTGGAGGFTVGIVEAITEQGADLVWLMDDDTVPDPGALAALLSVRDHTPAGTVVLASAVRWIDGRPHPMNTPRVHPFATRRSVERAGAFQCYPVRSASFVSILIEASAIRRAGLPIADYFLWNDDFEFSSRLLRSGRGYLCRGSTVEHRTKTFGSTDVDPGARFYFEVRNKIWLLRYSSALSGAERVLYAGATLRNWTRTIRKSSDRTTLFRGLRSGVKDGMSRPPRSNTEVLSGLGAVTDAVGRFEAGIPESDPGGA